MSGSVNEKRMCLVKVQGRAVMEALALLSSGVRELGQQTRNCPTCDQWPDCRLAESFELDFFAELSKVWEQWEEEVL
jgi:hypothetical protein